MINLITNIYIKILELSNESQIVAGAVSLWGLGVITWIFKVIPVKIFKGVKTQCTTTLEMDNAGGWEHLQMFNNCLKWLNTNKTAQRFSRNLSIYTTDERSGDEWKSTSSMGLGYGTHMFTFNKKLMWITINTLDSSGSELQKRSIKVSYLGRNKTTLQNFVKTFTPKSDKNEICTYQHTTGGEWEKGKPIKKRPLESIALDDELKDILLEEINHFNNNAGWYYSKGLPYKLTYILHGKPGTGKTSLIKAMASYFNKNLCTININNITDGSLSRCLQKLPNSAFVIIEDFDSISSIHNRKGKTSADESKVLEFLSLTGFLNALDGIESLDDVILFLTTNHLENIDEAVHRKGRVDHIIEMKETPAKAIEEYSSYIFPEYDFTKTEFNDTLGCNLNNAILSSKGNPEKYLEILNKKEEED